MLNEPSKSGSHFQDLVVILASILISLITLFWLGNSGYADMIETGSLPPQETSPQIRAIPVALEPVAGVDGRSSEVIIRSLPFDEPDYRYTFVYSLKLSAPQILSASAGVVFGQYQCLEAFPLVCFLKGVIFQAEPGLGGGKIAIGASLLGYLQTGSNNMGILEMPVVGIDLKTVLLRTWGPSVTLAPNQTFVGLEADIEFLLTKISLGLFRKIEGLEFSSKLYDGWTMSGGIGLGF